MSELVLWLDQLGLADLPQVGGKNASLGEMIGNLARLGVSVPGGFATTAHAYREFVAQSGLARRVFERLSTLDTDDVDALARAGNEIRSWVVETPLQSFPYDRQLRYGWPMGNNDQGGSYSRYPDPSPPIPHDEERSRNFHRYSESFLQNRKVLKMTHAVADVLHVLV